MTSMAITTPEITEARKYGKSEGDYIVVRLPIVKKIIAGGILGDDVQLMQLGDVHHVSHRFPTRSQLITRHRAS
jgi:hypothetical protein